MPCDEMRKKNLKRFTFVCVLFVLVVLVYHLYEYFAYDKREHLHTLMEYDILTLSKQIFKDELKQRPYLAKVNFQEKASSSNDDDHAQYSMLELHDELLSTNTSSTVALMRCLFDNYELDTHTVEKVTAEEKQEELEFLNAVLKTPIMNHTMRFLQQKGFPADRHRDQLALLQDIWFTQYSRGDGPVGSSGFEHIFLAEIQDHIVLGLHNWIYFSEQERQGNLDYKGYIQHVEFGKGGYCLAAVHFKFHSFSKPYNTLLIGTSPELEMSLYTICFLLKANEPCTVQLGTAKFDIITHVWDWKGKKILGTAYPSLESNIFTPVLLKKRRKKKSAIKTNRNFIG